jgi:hypothetical protein
MINNILQVLILLLVFILLFLLNYEKFSDINFIKFNSATDSLILHKPIYQNPIEINNLSKCNKKIKAEYKSNTANIINDNYSISQEIFDTLDQTIDIEGKNYNLIKIEWKKCNFMWNGKPIGLILKLIHNDFVSINNFNIIIPLDLIQEVEGFKNINYIKDNTPNTDTYLEYIDIKDIVTNKKYFNLDNTYTNIQNSFPDINDITIFEKQNGMDYNKSQNNIDNTNEIGKFNLSLQYNRNYDIEKYSANKLIHQTKQIPVYQCCKNSVGPLLTQDLCILNTIINNNTNAFILEEETGNIDYIIEPIPFNEIIGLQIRKLIINDNIKYLK